MFKKIIISAALLLSSSLAFAGDEGVYVGGDAGSSKIDGYSDRRGSFGAFGGYKFTRELAVEAGYRRLFSLNLFGADVDMKQTSLSLVSNTALGNDFEFIGRVGYNKLSAAASYFGHKGSASDSGALFGIGVGYNFTQNFSARLEAQRPSKDATNISAGLVFKF